MRFCYLASPIDQTNGETLHSSIENMLTNVGFFVFNPAKAFTMPHVVTVDDRVFKTNWRALTQADCVMAILPPGVPSIGVPMELERARQMGIPVAVVGPAVSWSLAAPGISRFDRIDQAVAWLDRETLGPSAKRVVPIYEMKVVRDHPDSQMPIRQYADDAGFDLFVAEETTIEPGHFKDVDNGITCELPRGMWAMITGRSSTIRKKGLLVAQGIIDGGYRGPIYSGVWNLTDKPVRVEKGERVAQMILFHNAAERTLVMEAERVNVSPRGAAGFGSTGD